MDADSYLRRIGLDPVDIDALDRDSLARLQRAHVQTVPFENLSIAGDPWDRRPGEGISLSMADLEAKVVERERGGFCYELNGLFTELLDQVGFEATRNAGRIVGDGGIELPASPLDSLRSSRSLADFPLASLAGIPASPSTFYVEGCPRSLRSLRAPLSQKHGEKHPDVSLTALARVR
jgi:arylamine N-acetyltransferase